MPLTRVGRGANTPRSSVGDELVEFAASENIPVCAAHDVYYLKPEDRFARETLVRVNSHGDGSDKISDSDEDDFSFITTERAEELFHDLPEALANTAKIVEQCTFKMTLGKWVFPKLTIESGLSPDDELRRLVFEGFAIRNVEQTPETEARAEYELKVIRDKGYAPYFLVVADLMRFAHEQGILSNIRGSVSGSMVTYLARITNINPILEFLYLKFDITIQHFTNYINIIKIFVVNLISH